MKPVKVGGKWKTPAGASEINKEIVKISKGGGKKALMKDNSGKQEIYRNDNDVPNYRKFEGGKEFIVDVKGVSNEGRIV